VDEVTFRTLPLGIAPGRVMTPRPASEQLVAAAIAHLGERAARVADVGTGSGAVAVAIAAALPQVRVWATDTDRTAVALARANVCRHGLDGRVIVRHGDLLAPVPGRIDMIVANLPYLPTAAASAHPDLALEPKAAVFADGDGLDPYRRLVASARTRLVQGGVLAIQLHRRVFMTHRDELDRFGAGLERFAPEFGALPLDVAA
jgi:release factor glutamine methyltransferase